MIPLKGSEKQVTWAASIRADVMTEVAIARAKIATIETRATHPHAPIAIALARAALDEMERQDSAAWWIDNAPTLKILAATKFLRHDDPVVRLHAERLITTGIK